MPGERLEERQQPDVAEAARSSRRPESAETATTADVDTADMPGQAVLLAGGIPEHLDLQGEKLKPRPGVARHRERREAQAAAGKAADQPPPVTAGDLERPQLPKAAAILSDVGKHPDEERIPSESESDFPRYRTPCHIGALADQTMRGELLGAGNRSPRAKFIAHLNEREAGLGDAVRQRIQEVVPEMVAGFRDQVNQQAQEQLGLKEGEEPMTVWGVMNLRGTKHQREAMTQAQTDGGVANLLHEAGIKDFPEVATRLVQEGDIVLALPDGRDVSLNEMVEEVRSNTRRDLMGTPEGALCASLSGVAMFSYFDFTPYAGNGRDKTIARFPQIIGSGKTVPDMVGLSAAPESPAAQFLQENSHHFFGPFLLNSAKQPQAHRQLLAQLGQQLIEGEIVPVIAEMKCELTVGEGSNRPGPVNVPSNDVQVEGFMLKQVFTGAFNQSPGRRETNGVTACPHLAGHLAARKFWENFYVLNLSWPIFDPLCANEPPVHDPYWLLPRDELVRVPVFPKVVKLDPGHVEALVARTPELFLGRLARARSKG